MCILDKCLLSAGMYQLHDLGGSYQALGTCDCSSQNQFREMWQHSKNSLTVNKIPGTLPRHINSLVNGGVNPAILSLSLSYCCL